MMNLKSNVHHQLFRNRVYSLLGRACQLGVRTNTAQTYYAQQIVYLSYELVKKGYNVRKIF